MAQKLNTILVVGLGDIGEHILEFLVRIPEISKIYGADRNEPRFRSKIYSALSGAIHQGFYPQVEFLSLDLNDIDSTARTLSEIEPDIVVTSAALKTWWAPQASMPFEVFRKLDEAGFGPWLPLHFTLVYKLMKAVRKSGIETHVINCSFPDAVNAVLGKLGMAPTVGLGNCDLFLPWLRKIVADRLSVPVSDVQLYFVGHHFLVHALGAYQSTLGCPYRMNVVVGDRDVTNLFNPDKLLIDANAHMPKGKDDHFIVAASAVKNVMGILQDTNQLAYAPGPEGLPGGYPIRLSREGAKVELPAGLGRREAIRVNQDSQLLDGIERIEDDGTVVFSAKANQIMSELLGYQCTRLAPEENEVRAKELLAAYDLFVAKYRTLSSGRER